MDRVAIFLDENLNEIGKKKFSSTDDFLTYKKGTFNVRLDAFLYRTKDTVYYAYIYSTDEKLLIDTETIKINTVKDKPKISLLKKQKQEPITQPIDVKGKDIEFTSARLVKIKERLEKGDLKLIVGENIIGQLARMAVMGLKNNWILIILVGVVCALAGGGVAYSMGLNNGIAQGFNQAQQIINATIPNIPSI